MPNPTPPVSRTAYVNGRYVAHRHASVHIEDRGYQFADGVYEVVYLSAGRFVDETRHLDRLDRSLREIRVPRPMSRAALQLILREVTRRNRVTHGLLYLQVTRGVAPREHAFPSGSIAPSLVVTIRRLPPHPEDVAGGIGTAITCPDERWARCDIKSTALLPNVLARQAAREQGASEAILVGNDGMVTEGAATNVWIVDRADVLRTRRLGREILPGCTRDALMTLMQKRGIPFQECAFSRNELLDAREVFLTSASSFVKPVVRIDDQPIGDGMPGPISRQLFALFARHVRDA
jgi:D-alanine transaminase